MLKKSFAKKDGGKVLLATAIALALIFGLATNGLKLRDKPPSWKITGERYGVDWQFRFGKSVQKGFSGCEGTCRVASVGVAQRNNLGPLYYERWMNGNYVIDDANKMFDPSPERDKLFAELQ